MNLPSYNSVIECDCPLIGTIPAHWSSSRLKFAVDPTRPITYGIVQCGPDVDEGVPYIRPVDMTDEGGIKGKVQKTTREIAAQYIRSTIRAGDLVISIGPSFGKCMVVPDELDGANLTQGTARVAVANSRAHARYIFWLLRSQESKASWTANSSGATFVALTLENLANTPSALPPLNEQFCIANFLDRETAKIDALIDKQEQMIKLLEEKRQAVISHAVTKGLNPDVRMKDSGIASVGLIPDHWNLTKVKYQFRNLDYRRIPLSVEERSYRKGEYPYYGASGIIDGVDDYLFEKDLVLVSEDGANLVIRSTPIAFIARGKYWVNNHAHILEPFDGAIEYWSERLEALDIRPLVSGAAQPKLTAEALSNLIVACPSTREERIEIAEFVDRQKQEISVAIAPAQKVLSLLKERRTALISAVVTGKIDVREAV